MASWVFFGTQPRTHGSSLNLLWHLHVKTSMESGLPCLNFTTNGMKKFLKQLVCKFNMFFVISILTEWFILNNFYCRDLICISPVRKPCFIKIVNDATTVALPKIEQVKNTFSNVVFSLLSHCQRLKCSFYFIVTLPKIKQVKILLKMSYFLYCSVGGRWFMKNPEAKNLVTLSLYYVVQQRLES